MCYLNLLHKDEICSVLTQKDLKGPAFLAIRKAEIPKHGVVGPKRSSFSLPYYLRVPPVWLQTLVDQVQLLLQPVWKCNFSNHSRQALDIKIKVATTKLLETKIHA